SLDPSLEIIVGLAEAAKEEFPHIVYEAADATRQLITVTHHVITVPFHLLPDSSRGRAALLHEITQNIPESIRPYFEPTHHGTQPSSPLRSDRYTWWWTVSQILEHRSFEGIRFSDALLTPTDLLLKIVQHMDEHGADSATD